MHTLRTMRGFAAAIVLGAMLVIMVCAGMAAPAMAQNMPADCPLHPHQQQPASCCAANHRSDAVTEPQVRLPDLALAEILPLTHVVFDRVAVTSAPLPEVALPPPPELVALRI